MTDYELLEELGARLLTPEDTFDDRRSGWWLDNVYLGDTEEAALEAING